ncbi:MFS transporter [Novosphingobium bradum]|uniref:MFS transporter n=1 Tax=Novosphingobium bradum TaxID=1737444 RepID=A0ABV7IJ21_9SPHN
MTAPLTARQEWATMWQLPVTTMLGIAGVSAFAYSNGVFLGEITKEFGWTRAQFSGAFTFQMLVGILIAPFAGRMVDRFGTRRVLSVIILPHLAMLAVLGTINGSVTQWQLLCVLSGLIGVFGAPAIWMAAVVRRFDASRGLAVAVSLAGLGLASMIWPLLSAAYVQAFGWRLAFGAIALTFGAIIIPLIYFYIPRAPVTTAANRPVAPDLRTEVLPNLRSRTFLFVVVAAGLFGMVTLGLNFHMVPLMKSKGFSLTTAAFLASATGLASFSGRLLTGFLLDRLPTRTIGVIAFLLPIPVVLVLGQSGANLWLNLATVIVFGLASGAETDIITYIIARTMPRMFGTAYAIAISFVGAAASSGPLLAGALYDRAGSYDLFLMCVIPIVSTGALLIWLLPPVQPREIGPADAAPVAAH